MKLLFLTEFFPANDQRIFTGGVESRVYYTVNQAKKDFSVKVIASTSKQIPATGLSVFSRILYLFIAFIKALRTEFDLIEASNVVVYLPAYLAARLKKKPVVIWVPDVLKKSWFDFGFFVGISGYLMEKLYLSLSWDGVIALSRSTQTKLIAAGIKTKEMSVIHGGIDPAEFKIKPAQHQLAQTTICCVARLVKTKRIDTLINAMALLAGRFKLRLLIIGQGPQKNKLERLISQSQLTQRITLINSLPRQELIDTLKQSTLFCLPSVVEGFGLATIEAMAAGLPVILTGIPVNQEITHSGQGCLFFQQNNPRDLALKISLLLSDRKLYAQKHLEAKKLAEEYSWHKAYQQTKSFYETCLSL